MIFDAIINNIGSSIREQQARQENYAYGEMQAKNADARTRALYNDFYSPEALKRQYQEAGLSPALMFGGTPGQGGQSGSMGSSAAVHPTYSPISILEAAQAANIMAQTKKTEAETKTITGENERGLAEIANLWSQNGYTEVSAALKAEEVTQQQWQNYITSESAESNINLMYATAEAAATNAQKAVFEMISAGAQAEVDEKTIQSRIKLIQEQVKMTEAETLLKKSGIKLNEANRQKAIQEIKNLQEEVKQQWQHIYIELYNSRTERAKWRTMDEAMLRTQKVAEDRFKFDEQLAEKEFLWMIVNDTYNNMLNTTSLVTPTPTKPKKK